MSAEQLPRLKGPGLLPKADGRSRLRIDKKFSVWPEGQGVSLTYNPNASWFVNRYNEPTIVEFGRDNDEAEVFKTLEYPRRNSGHEEREPNAEETVTLLYYFHAEKYYLQGETRDKMEKARPLLGALRRKAVAKIQETAALEGDYSPRVKKLRTAYHHTIPEAWGSPIGPANRPFPFMSKSGEKRRTGMLLL